MKAQVTKDRKFVKVIEATPQELEQFQMTFTKKIDNWRFHPLVKRGLWDGNISYIQHGVYFPIGLWNEFLKMGQKFGIPIELYGIEEIFNKIDRVAFDVYCKQLFDKHPKIKPYDYQINAAYNILKYGLSTSEIATSAGKTLICFLVFIWMKEKMGIEKFLMVVPKTGLVTQGLEDFQDYNQGCKIKFFAKGISKGSKELVGSANFVIGNYQTLTKREKEFFEPFQALCCDECLHPDSLIEKENGDKVLISDIKIGDKVKTYNEDLHQIEVNEVEFVYENLSKNEKVFELELEDGKKIKLTGNHKVLLVNGEYKRVDCLNFDDDVLIYNS